MRVRPVNTDAALQVLSPSRFEVMVKARVKADGVMWVRKGNKEQS